MKARYHGSCHYRCGHRIKPGDDVTRIRRGGPLAHKTCQDKAPQPAAPTSPPPRDLDWGAQRKARYPAKCRAERGCQRPIRPGDLIRQSAHDPKRFAHSACAQGAKV